MTGQQVFPFAHATFGRVARGKASQAALASGSGGASSSRREPLTPYPRVSHAAVRVPDPRHTPLEFHFPSGHPQIFVHEGARQALERRLTMANGGPVILSVTDNVRQMVSHTLLTMGGAQPAARVTRSSKQPSKPANGILQLRLHHMFLDAPAGVQDALVRYVTAGDRVASQLVGQYIEDNGFRIRASRPVSRPLITQGTTHDLYVLFHAINDKYFGGGVDALITWGRWGRRSQSRTPGSAGSAGTVPRRSIKLGSYSATERLIRVHPTLDRPWVPRYFVSYIVYHEMLHHVTPGSLGNGRRMLHPPMFMERERAFRDYDRALAWERAHISRLLRS